MTPQRVRIRWTKLGRVRFVSARDLTSVWERALRRADLPIAYSEGFTPHPKVSFPDALPVGFESEGNYAELTFMVPLPLEKAMASLSAALPQGMDILTYVEVPPGAPKLARMLRATLWELQWSSTTGSAEMASRLPALATAAERLLAADSAEVVRRRKDKDVTFDVRPPLLAIGVQPTNAADEPRPVLRAVLSNDGPAVRPTDLFTALAERCDEELPTPRLFRRVAQGEPVEDGIREALSGTVERLRPGRLAETA